MIATSETDLRSFIEWLRIPSISAEPNRAGDLLRAAAWAADYLGASGLQARLEDIGDAPPLVIAHAPRLDGASTVLLYGHYEVQPAAVSDGWTGDPFEPRSVDGFIMARGATDNKGQTFSHMMGLRRALARGPLPLNVVVVLDGEEEIGSPHLGLALNRLREELRCSIVIVSDTSMVAPGWPALCLGLRGICVLNIRVTTAEAEVHSGIFGGSLHNPAQILCELLSAARAPDGRICIPSLLRDLVPPHAQERKSWASLPWDDKAFAIAARASVTDGEPGIGALERLWARPTFEINGITSGYQGTGLKTIIPVTASAKISLRLVEPQRPEEVARNVAEFLYSRCPAGVELSVDFDQGGLPYLLSPENPFLRTAGRALQEVFGREPALVREGLSIPAMTLFRRELKADTILAGLGLPGCRAHGPDETFPIEHLALGAELHERLLVHLAQELGRR